MTTQTLTLTDFLLARIAEARESILTRAASAPSLAGQMYPTRAIAKCDAERRIVGLHTYPAACCYWTQGGNDSHEPGEVCETLAALATPYADHPDYREEWKP